MHLSILGCSVSFLLCLSACGQEASRPASTPSESGLQARVDAGRGHFQRLGGIVASVPVRPDSLWQSVAWLERKGALHELTLGVEDGWAALRLVVAGLAPHRTESVQEKTAERPAPVAP